MVFSFEKRQSRKRDGKQTNGSSGPEEGREQWTLPPTPISPAILPRRPSRCSSAAREVETAQRGRRARTWIHSSENSVVSGNRRPGSAAGHTPVTSLRPQPIGTAFGCGCRPISVVASAPGGRQVGGCYPPGLWLRLVLEGEASGSVWTRELRAWLSAVPRAVVNPCSVSVSDVPPDGGVRVCGSRACVVASLAHLPRGLGFPSPASPTARILSCPFHALHRVGAQAAPSHSPPV